MMDATEFNDRRSKCSQPIRETLDFLMTVAEHVGSDSVTHKFEVRGTGITYWSKGNRFCRFDPKQVKHVQALIPQAHLDALDKAGLEYTRSDTDGPWIRIKDLRDAVRLVPFILKAHDDLVDG